MAKMRWNKQCSNTQTITQMTQIAKNWAALDQKPKIYQAIVELMREDFTRRSLYPWLIKNGKLTPAEAEQRQKRLNAALQILRTVAQGVEIETPLPPNYFSFGKN